MKRGRWEPHTLSLFYIAQQYLPSRAGRGIIRLRGEAVKEENRLRRKTGSLLIDTNSIISYIKSASSTPRISISLE
jgi:hypothetical protein